MPAHLSGKDAACRAPRNAGSVRGIPMPTKMTASGGMMGLASEVDVAVIGAGAAGIGAARLLAEAGRGSVLVLDGRQRPGGRAWTVDAGGFPADMRCEWLPSADRSVLVPLAELLGLALNRRRPDW